MEADTVKLHTGHGVVKTERPKSGTELFDKMLLTEFGEFCLNSFAKGCIRHATDLEAFKARFPNQTELIMLIFNHLLETDKLTVNDNGYFTVGEYLISLTISKDRTDEENRQIQFLYSEKVKKMSMSALESARTGVGKTPYIGSMVFTISDNPEVETKKSALVAEIITKLKELSKFDERKIVEGYKPKNLTNFAFIGAISNPDVDSSEVI